MNGFQNAFISYGRADSKNFALKLYQHLRDHGLKVWFDFEDIPLGVDFQNQIDDGIEKADNFLYIIAPHSSFPNMHPEIGKINWVYFREGIDDFDKSLAGLLELLDRHQTYVHQHTYFLAKALEWERNQQQSRYLLVGEECQQALEWLKVRFKDEQPPCTPTDLHCEYITESIKSAHNLMTQVFLAYASEDKPVMEKIRNSLRREGFTVWTNTTDIQTGEAFEKAIGRGIEQADNVVYLLSPDALNSEYCQQEFNYALSLNKRIIPVLVRETELQQIPNVLRSLQYIDLTDNVQSQDYRLDENQLIKILHQDEAYYRQNKVLLVKALNWQRQSNNPSILRRGYNLCQAEAWLKTARHRQQHLPTSIQEEFITTSLQQPPASSLDVFICYSRADSDLAHKLNAVSFSPDGQAIASASDDNTVKLWRQDGSLLATLKGHNDKVKSVAFSPDGELIASGSSDNTVKLWDRNGTLLASVKAHNGPVNDVSFSPDSQTIASGSVDNTIKLWNRQGTLLATVKGHSDSVNDVVFSPDGQKIVSVSADNSVKLWNRQGTLQTTLYGHSDGVNSVALSPDSQTVVSVGSDKKVILWNLAQDLELQKLQTYGCNWLQDCLRTNAELDESDRQVCDAITASK